MHLIGFLVCTAYTLIIFTAYTVLFESLPEANPNVSTSCYYLYPNCVVASSGAVVDDLMRLFFLLVARIISGSCLLPVGIIQLIIDEVLHADVSAIFLFDFVANAVGAYGASFRTMILASSATTCGTLSLTWTGFELCRKQMAYARHVFLSDIIYPLDKFTEFVFGWNKIVSRIVNFYLSFLNEHATVLRYILLLVGLLVGLAHAVVLASYLMRLWRLRKVLQANPGLDFNNIRFIRTGTRETMVAVSQQINVGGVWIKPVAG